MNKVRLGIIGIGNMGSGHAMNLVKDMVEEAILFAVADIREERRQWAKDNLPRGIRIFESGDDLIENANVDAIFICTPHYLHPELAIKGFKKGLHVLSEKPAGVYTKQVRMMNEEAAKHDLVFGMMFNQRTNPVYIKMRELVQSGVYGQIKRVNWIITDWYRTQAYYNSGSWRATWDGEGGGVLLNQCPHNLDLLQWICGMPESIRAFCHEGKWHDIEVEDDVTAYFEYSNKATGVFITSTGDAPGTNRFEIDLEKAKIVSEHGKLMIYELKENEREFCFSTTEGFAQPEGEWIEVETPGDNSQHIGVLKAFAKAILNKTPLIADGSEGINGLTLSNAMHLSSWLDKKITLPIDEDVFLDELNKRRKTSKVKTNVTEATFDTEGTY